MQAEAEEGVPQHQLNAVPHVAVTGIRLPHRVAEIRALKAAADDLADVHYGDETAGLPDEKSDMRPAAPSTERLSKSCR